MSEEIEYFDFVFDQITYAIFDVPTYPDPTISFLCKIPNKTGNGGAVYCVNMYFLKKKEAIFDDTRIMDGCYTISKRKIISHENATLGYEGRILNDPRFC